MKKVLLFLVILVFISSCKTILESSPNLSKLTSLFNSKDLNGWSINGSEKWYVQQAELVCENGPDEDFGYIITDKQYKNFELTLEYKRDLKSNGGVFIHSTIDESKIKGFQVEIAAPGHSTGGIHEYDRGWLIKPELEKDNAIKLNEWNQMKIRVHGDQLITWLNGTQMVSLSDQQIGVSNGGIALQIHGGKSNKLQWRNIYLVEL